MFKQLTLHTHTRDESTMHQGHGEAAPEIPEFPQRLDQTNSTAFQLLSRRNYQEIPSRENEDETNLALLQ